MLGPQRDDLMEQVLVRRARKRDAGAIIIVFRGCGIRSSMAKHNGSNAQEYENEVTASSFPPVGWIASFETIQE